MIVKAIPVPMIFRTAPRALGVRTLSGVTSAPSTSAHHQAYILRHFIFACHQIQSHDHSSLVTNNVVRLFVFSSAARRPSLHQQLASILSYRMHSRCAAPSKSLRTNAFRSLTRAV